MAGQCPWNQRVPRVRHGPWGQTGSGVGQCPWGWGHIGPQEQQDRAQGAEGRGMPSWRSGHHEARVEQCPGLRSMWQRGSLGRSGGSWQWGGLRTAGFGRGVMRFISPRETAGEWSLVAELVNATSRAQSYCSPLVFSFADFCFYFRPAGGLMYPTACLFFLLIISVSLKKDITSLCKPCLHCSQQSR